ncbi:acyl-CoA dehydrogenase family protein [Paenibacillus pinihumi]|uniref:acyl-CoA dehydrogenase family protein n=1 Tax=Paenibacillus pinihumi TaxID=669462 RepID=UPI0003F69BF2|nr:acyl-CoA dehydrogenase family protein [Paenibacillus pinihumi]
MIGLLSREQKEKYTEFGKFVQSNVQPFAWEWEINECIPREVIDKCAEAGYMGGILPEEFGGQGWDHLTYGVFTEVVAKASTSLSGLFNVHTMVMKSILKWGTEEQKQKWLPSMTQGKVLGALALTEPEAGSDIQGITTTFTETEDKIIINGTKRWITFGGLADVFIVFGKMNGQDEKATAVIVEKNAPGLNVVQIKNMIGFKASALAVLEFDNCEISKENVLAKPGFALSHIAPYALDYGRISVAFTALGIMRGCLEYCTSHVLKRKTFGEKLISHSTIKEMITKMGVDYEAAAHLCIHSCHDKENHHPSSAEKVIIAKYFTTKAARKHSDNAVQILGAMGCNESHPVARYYRDTKTLEIIEGSNQIIEMILGNSFARKYRSSEIKAGLGSK